MEPHNPGIDAPDGEPLATPPPAPAVVAVVVARDPGPWLEEAMEALAAQDYPNQSILVIDAGSPEPVKARVARSAPGAFVRRLDDDAGFGAAANEVLEVVDGAAFYLFCHDDVALAPDAVRLLVEEAFRSNAAVVGPKLVEWDDPRRLQQVGQGMDAAGYGVPLVERGELDQSQHDAVRDVFTVPGPCTLVREDLFSAIGGFDEGISDFLDDVSLCWRAHIAGARVIVAPDAVARQRDELAQRRGYDERRRLQARHRLRLVMSCYGALGLVWALLKTIVLNVVELIYSLIAGRTRRAGDVVDAWTWNLRRLPELRVARRQVKGFRNVPDREVRQAMSRGSARMNQFVRGQIGKGEDRFTGLAGRSRGMAGVFTSGTLKATASVWVGVAFVLLVGSRHLLTRGVPAIGEMVAFSLSPIDLWRSWASGWRGAGLGSVTPAPTAFGMIGALGAAFIGAMGMLRTVLTVGMIPLGAVLAYRLPSPTGSRWAQIVCLLVYVSIPLPYNALADGRWGALVLYAAAPVMVGMLASLSRIAPFGPVGADSPVGRPRSWRGRVVALGLVTALVATVLPSAVVIVVGMALALGLGGFVATNPQGSARMVGGAAAAAGLAVVLHLPWALGFLGRDTTLSSFTGVPRTDQISDLAALMRFEIGPLGSAPIGWCFLVAAALPLLIARAERHAWAVRGWTMAVVSFALAWAAQRGDLPVALPAVDVLLVPAAAGLALATAMGVLAFEVDLPGYRFGWRQVASGVAAAAVVAGMIPIVGASFDGRWSMPAGDYTRALSFIDAENDASAFRVLWLGDPAAVPFDGWALDDGLVYGTTDAGSPTLENLWVGSDDGPSGLLAEALELASSGQTARLGRLLAPMGVRYIVVPEGLAPEPFARPNLPVPASVAATLEAQLDLEPVDVPAGLTVYRNEAFMPTRAGVPASVDIPVDGGIASALTLDLSGAPAVLPDTEGRVSWSGPVDDDTTVLLSASGSGRWELEVDGSSADRIEPFGWSNGFEVSRGGDADLSFHTSPLLYLVLVIQTIAWLWVLRAVLWHRFDQPVPDEAVET